MNEEISTPIPASLWVYLAYQYPATRGDIPLQKCCNEIAELQRDLTATQNNVKFKAMEADLDAAKRAVEKAKELLRRFAMPECGDCFIYVRYDARRFLHIPIVETEAMQLATLDSLNKELEQLRADKVRLDWLMEDWHRAFMFFYNEEPSNDIRTAIDHAIEKQKEGGK